MNQRTVCLPLRHKGLCSRPGAPRRLQDLVLPTGGGERRSADLHGEEEYGAGKNSTKEQTQVGRAARKVNPAVGINRFRKAEMNQPAGLDQFHLWHQCTDVSRQTSCAVGFDHFDGANFVPFRNTFIWYSTDLCQPMGWDTALQFCLLPTSSTQVHIQYTSTYPVHKYNACSSTKHELLMHHTLYPLLHLGTGEHKRLLKSGSSVMLISTSILNQTSG